MNVEQNYLNLKFLFKRISHTNKTYDKFPYACTADVVTAIDKLLEYIISYKFQFASVLLMQSQFTLIVNNTETHAGEDTLLPRTIASKQNEGLEHKPPKH